MPRTKVIDLEGKVALVTGGGKGLGLAVTQTFVEAGAKVVIIGRNKGDLETAAHSIGNSVIPIAADVADPDTVRSAFANVEQTVGGLDFLINNAAVFPIFKIEEASDEELRQPLDINLLGPLHTIRCAVPLMRKRGGGVILNVSSESVKPPVFPLLSVYAASKAGLEVLSDYLRAELRPEKIRVVTFRVGRMASGTEERSSWDEEKAKAFVELVEKYGTSSHWTQPMPIDEVANVMLDIVTSSDLVAPENVVLREP